MLNLLASGEPFFTSKSVEVTFWISLITIIVLIASLIAFSKFRSKLNSQTIVYSGVSIAASFALSIIPIPSFVVNGGSITIASLVPIIIFSYYAGIIPGLICGMVYGLLQFIYQPFFLDVYTFILDYILAFMPVGLVGLFKNKLKLKQSMCVGITLVYALRLTIHLISGVIYFNKGEIWTSLPQTNPFIYSFLYNIIYLVPDYIICLIATLALVSTGVVNQLFNTFKLRFNNNIQNTDTTCLNPTSPDTTLDNNTIETNNNDSTKN